MVGEGSWLVGQMDGQRMKEFCAAAASLVAAAAEASSPTVKIPVPARSRNSSANAALSVAGSRGLCQSGAMSHHGPSPSGASLPSSMGGKAARPSQRRSKDAGKGTCFTGDALQASKGMAKMAEGGQCTTGSHSPEGRQWLGKRAHEVCPQTPCRAPYVLRRAGFPRAKELQRHESAGPPPAKG